MLFVDLGQKTRDIYTKESCINSSKLFICPLPLIKNQKELLPTPMINNTVSPSTPPEPSSGFYQTHNEMELSVGSIQNNLERKFPCPVKFRYKYLNITYKPPQ